MEHELESSHPVSVCAEIFLQSRDLQSRERCLRQANANAATGYTKSIAKKRSVRIVSDYRSISSSFQDFHEIQFYFSSVIDAMSSLLLGWMQL
ncbi:MAG: hypothetical protein HWQ35_05145 [Nostoc sp. NMS1]|uniref:hypothetical protein n=1 Tax=unclassified Nostoc TaxID=2593658 RepID=UPI0015C351AD|nr:MULTISPECIES: hypothetical protein [unclassified Nostoc]MBN3905951.1 hypothetical protein [Nostoc sp. NMS1]QLE53438.1 hypothetical protein FD724_36630 [Nostoc sp. C057]